MIRQCNWTSGFSGFPGFLKPEKPGKPRSPNSIFKEYPIDFQGEKILEGSSADFLRMSMNVSAGMNVIPISY